MVEQRTLTPLVLVRVQVPQPIQTKACIFLQAFVFLLYFFRLDRFIFRTGKNTVVVSFDPLIFLRFTHFRRVLKFAEWTAEFIACSTFFINLDITVCLSDCILS